MKRVWIFSVTALIAISLTGCQSGKKTSNIDDAQGAIIQETPGSNIAAPPVPPVPSRPAK